MHSYFIITWGLTNFLLLIACILGIVKIPVLKKYEKQYVYFLCFLLAVELATNFLTLVLNYKDTSFLYPIYIAGEFFILTGLFINKLKLSKYFFVPTALLAAGFVAANWLFDISSNNDIGKVASNITVICFAGYVLLQEIKNSSSDNRFTLADAFIFFYYSVSVFIFIIQHQIASLSEDDYYVILGINNMLSSLLYGSFLYTFLKLKK